MTDITSHPIRVPMQPYAGKRLIIENLIVPDSSDDLKVEPKSGEKPVSAPKFMDMPRPTFLEKKWIERTLFTYCSLNGLSTVVNEELVEGLLAAAETFLKDMMQTVIEFSEHRSGNSLYDDPRCELHHDLRTTMRFLDDREVADYGCSDDDTAYGHRRRWMKLQRNRNPTNSFESEIRLESTNKTALLALGVRKPQSATATVGLPNTAPGLPAAGAGTAAQLPKRQFFVRIKHMKVRDIIQYMENEKRFNKSKLLYDAYLSYKF
ncbi:transcription initiation factor TFIID subunit 4 [Drosophila grimshawi]|uniref:GH13121 n=1 Tax=Drosophila grimshawi TaxID=7222 RepID=B4JQT5_DROGR|nr:transcription initiation factor TFIID subunit 4 [Drosophila grimshawi]XP_032595353.1 transcription initiation factor TFIID subunit 4 [Drosophila grimshawi]XP_032595354.1 transcription initiation factor TFIID subunit 4 [Drosophila grimshawi]XP_043070480.1 transcription initiation factor TFIID subunit 4 [Drosophila grimshawi]EDV99265.1 GH13121 [Drosophila grimshawi]